MTLIVELLETRDLMKLSAAHEHFSFAVKYNLRHRLAKKVVTFGSPYTDGELGHTVTWPIQAFHGVRESPGAIFFSHLPFILDFLEHFGNLIQSLKLIQGDDSKGNATHVESVWQATNRYCSENLTQLLIVDRNNASLLFERPFNRIEMLTLEGEFERLSGGNMFPAVRQLVLNEIRFDEADWLDHEFPLLDNLHVMMEEMPDVRGLNGTEFDRFIQNNQHIHNLTLKYANAEILECVAKKLQYLEHLRLVFYDTDIRRNIHLANLKTLIVGASPLHFIEDITFSSIKEYEVSVYSDGWFEAIQGNVGMTNSLRKLRIKRNMNDFEILQIANAKLNLTEIYFQVYDDVRVETIIQLIESSQGLQRLRIHVGNIYPWQAAVDALQDRLSGQWEIIQSPDHVELKRKEAD